jgi:hypothetical protein
MQWTPSSMGKKGGLAGKGKHKLSSEQSRAMLTARWAKYRENKKQENNLEIKTKCTQPCVQKIDN